MGSPKVPDLCISGERLLYLTVMGAGLGAMLVSWLIVEAAQRRHNQHRAVLRRIQEPPGHIHTWHRGEPDMFGIMVEECVCEAVRFVRERSS